MSNAVPLERVNFFDGKLLAAEDLSLEQTYHLERHRRHNRYLHGWGVVSGLSVSVADNTTITVQPGVAIDCAGNELVVHECIHLSLNGPLDKYFVCIRYTESPAQPMPNTAGMTVFARIQEGVVAELRSVNPALGHHRKGPGTPGCGLAHWLCVATIRQHNGRWRVASQKQ